MAGGLESLAILPLIGAAASVGSMAIPNPTAKKVLGGVGAASSLGSLAGLNPTVASTFGMSSPGAPIAGMPNAATNPSAMTGPLSFSSTSGTDPIGWKDRLSMIRDLGGLASTAGGLMTPTGEPEQPMPAPPPDRPDESGTPGFQPTAGSFAPGLTELLRGPRNEDRIGKYIHPRGLGLYGMA